MFFERPIKWTRSVRWLSWVDLAILFSLVLFIYGMVGLGREWARPFHSSLQIDLSLSSLPRYAFFSLTRGFVAYGISLVFSLAYGYLASHSRAAERVLIPLLDILQSIPVVGFLPGLMLALVALFPHSNVGLELASILTIFTGQAWNMAFSFYASVRSIPNELTEAASLFRLGPARRFRQLELPFAMNGLLWNSMVSMAGGWFFLMVSESFTLGDQSFRLPGIGAYMAAATEKHDIQAMIACFATMSLVIVVVDRCFWAPLVVWSERFKFDRDPSMVPPKSFMLDLLHRSNLLVMYFKLTQERSKRRERKGKKTTAKREPRGMASDRPPGTGCGRASVHGGLIAWMPGALILLVPAVIVLFGSWFLVKGALNLGSLLSQTPSSTWLYHVRNTALTLLRVVASLGIGSLWTIPLGVLIGTHPQWARRMQPLVQVVASFPAPMVYPAVIYLLKRWGVGIEIGSVFLMLLGSQWYILFNVIGGASLIPREMRDVAGVFQVRGFRRWTTVLLPGIFPHLVTGWVTAAGGAWNASIVSEFVFLGGTTLIATGIGSDISQAAQAGDYPVLAGGILVLVGTVVCVNRLVWRRLYILAETRYRLE